MRNSKLRSMRDAHLFGYDDQRSQDHKKIAQQRLDGNRFVIREVPIQRLFNGGQCANGSGDLSGFNKGKNFSAGMNIMDYDMPELVVFIQEDPQQFVKDTCIDRVATPEGKSLSEDCDLDHDTCHVDPNMNSVPRKSSTNSNSGTVERISTTSEGSECAFQHPSIKDATEKYDWNNLMVKRELELDLGGKISTDDHPTKKKTSQTLGEVFKKDAEFARSFKNWQLNSYLGTTSSRVEYPHCACAYCAQFTNTTSMSKPEILGNSQSIIGSGKRQIDYPEEIFSYGLGPLSGKISYSGPAATSSSAPHHQSNDSTSSTHSFAFPILPAEWIGSPVRMAEADKSQSRKRQWWKMRWFPCFKCC